MGASDSDVVFWLMISILVALLGTAAEANPQTVESVLSFLGRQSPVGLPVWFYALALAVIAAAIGIGLYDRYRKGQRP